jgi:uncharacterized protein (TIGR02466 family)
MKIVELFPIPMLVVNIKSELDAKEIHKLKLLSLDRANLVTNGQNGNMFHKEADLLLNYLPNSQLEKTLQKYLDIFLYDVWLEKEAKVKITGSWVNINPKGTMHHKHYHSNAILSGVLYLDTDAKNNGAFQTHKPEANARQVAGYAFGANQFTEQFRNFYPENYDLYIFPSTLDHSVDYNRSEKARMSFSFNAFYYGELMRNPKSAGTSLTKLTLGISSEKLSL